MMTPKWWDPWGGSITGIALLSTAIYYFPLEMLEAAKTAGAMLMIGTVVWLMVYFWSFG